MPILLALLTVVAGFVLGVVLFVTGHTLLGFVGCLVAFPAAIAVWIAANDRMDR